MNVAVLRYLAKRLVSGPHCAEKEKETPVPGLVSQACGMVLEIGPGIGNQIPRYDKSKITKIYGVEPNPDFKEGLERQIKAAGLTDEYSIVPHGIDDAKALEKYGIKPESIDTILDIQVLCSVPDPEAAAKAMYGMLKPGGKWIVYEHVRSRDVVSRWVQSTFSLLMSFEHAFFTMKDLKGRSTIIFFKFFARLVHDIIRHL